MARAGQSENKKKNARVADGPRAPGFARSLRDTAGILFRPLVPLTVLIVVYAGISFLLWRPLNGESGSFESAQQARLSEAILRNAVLSKPRPPWISVQDFRQIAQDGAVVVGNRSIFDPGISRKLAQAYEKNPWVERVKEVRLRFPARVELEIEFRRPYARTDRNTVLDRQGYALNLSADIPAVKDLPLLSGLAKQNYMSGKRCNEKLVQDALDLLSVVRESLAQSPGYLRVTNLEQKSGRWRVATDKGPAVLWGEFTDEPPIDEPRTQEKASLLRRKLCEAKDPTILETVNVYDARGPVKRRDAMPTNGLVPNSIQGQR